MESSRSNDRDKYSELGEIFNKKHTEALSTQLSVFRSALINFANDHGDEIKEKDEFRNKFTQICQLVGVDPLELMIHTFSKSQKRNESFYSALAVRIVEICKLTREMNGGIMSMKELISRLSENVNLETPITDSDVKKLFHILESLGGGFEFININGKQWLKFSSTSSGGKGMSSDQQKIYEMCEFMGGYVTVKLLRDNYGWDTIRCSNVLEELIMDGYLWIDSQAESGVQYWVPSWIST